MTKSLNRLRLSDTCIAASAILVVLLPISALSQTSSLRGTAKVEDRFVVSGVMVVLIPKQGSSAVGTPIPARVGTDGEYRIEAIMPGSYTLKAIGKTIQKKVVPDVRIVAGNSNVQNITLERAGQHTNLRTKLLNANGQPIKNSRVAIYSAELPPSICENCMLAEIRSNDDGEVQYSELAGEQNYSLAVSIYDESNKRDIKLIAQDLIAIGAEAETRIELQLGDGPQPTLTAKLLPNDQSVPYRMGPPLGDTTYPAGSRTVASGMRLRINGVVTRRDSETFIVRDMNGVDTVVRLTDETSVRTKGGFLRGGTNYALTSILRGLNLEVEGRGNATGELLANKIRFSESDLRVARAVESRAAPLEERASDTENKLSEAEANAQRLSGQLEELAAVSNAARGGAKAAQATADAAVAGVTATNERISALDDFAPQTSESVSFRSGSAELSPEAMTTLDDIASQAMNAKGYVLEISGFSDSQGTITFNRALSQRRADAVIRYLVEKHGIPLRRIVTPYGYGEINPVAENTTRKGRAQNRRVEIKLLVNKGLTSPTPTMNPKGDD